MSEHQKLLDSLRFGDASVSIYDTAYVLRSGILEDQAIKKINQYLIDQQHSDGSWGSVLGYIHDRVINTLAVIIAWKELGFYDQGITKAEAYLARAIPNLKKEVVETIGFEFTFPNLIEEGRRLKINIPYNTEIVSYYLQMKEQKLGGIPKSALQNITTLSHSLEALPFDEMSFSGMQLSNGSFGNSPAATAHFIRHSTRPNPRAIQYLKTFEKNGWLIPSIYPFEIFEKAWVLYHYMHAGILFSMNFKSHTDYLWHHWIKYEGASISNDFPVIDSDDSAIVYIVLKATGYPVDAKAFEKFELDGWFRCFDLERNPSISANIHVLEAINRSKTYMRRDAVIKKIIHFLSDALSNTWIDKWHISPFYCASHLILALRGMESPLLKKAVDFLRNNRNSDGGWGVKQSTFEETQYVSLALNSVKDEFLQWQPSCPQDMNDHHPELWVDKGLYCPWNVVKSLNAVCSYATRR